jgi:hypothetical protein
MVSGSPRPLTPPAIDLISGPPADAPLASVTLTARSAAPRGSSAEDHHAAQRSLRRIQSGDAKQNGLISGRRASPRRRVSAPRAPSMRLNRAAHKKISAGAGYAHHIPRLEGREACA